MNRRTKIAIVTLAFSALLYAVCAAIILSGKITDAHRSHFSDIGYLRGRINRLEAELESIKDETRGCIDCIVTEMVTDTQSEETSALTDSTESDTATSLFEYTVKEYDGKIGVFVIADGHEHPVRVLNISVATLAEDDRAALAAGIYAESYAELCKIIDRFE